MKKNIIIGAVVLALLLAAGTTFYFIDKKEEGYTTEEMQILFDTFYDLKGKEKSFDYYIEKAGDYKKDEDADIEGSYLYFKEDKSDDIKLYDFYLSDDEYVFKATSIESNDDTIEIKITSEEKKVTYTYDPLDGETCKGEYDISKNELSHKVDCDEKESNKKVLKTINEVFFKELDNLYGKQVLNGKKLDLTIKVSDEEKYLNIAKDTFASKALGTLAGEGKSGIFETDCCRPEFYTGEVSNNIVSYQIERIDFGPNDMPSSYYNVEQSLIDGIISDDTGQTLTVEPYYYEVLVDIESDICTYSSTGMSLSCEMKVNGDPSQKDWVTEPAKENYKYIIVYNFDNEDKLSSVSMNYKYVTYSDTATLSDEENKIYSDYIDGEEKFVDLSDELGWTAFENLICYDEYSYTITY